MEGNAGTVKRSVALLGYTKDLHYKEFSVYSSFFSGFNTYVMFAIIGIFLSVPPLMKYVGKYFIP